MSELKIGAGKWIFHRIKEKPVKVKIKDLAQVALINTEENEEFSLMGNDLFDSETDAIKAQIKDIRVIQEKEAIRYQEWIAKNNTRLSKLLSELAERGVCDE